MSWQFWKKKNKKKKSNKSEFRNWAEAILFAVVAATILRTFLIEAYTIPTSSMEKSMLIGDFLFVSKTSYGPRVPITPIAFPLVHHTLPFTKNKKSYSEIIKLPFHRMQGFGDVERNDCVVFNWPAEKLGRPVDKKENYVKRCVGIPGDEIEVINGVLNVNKSPQEEPIGMKKQFLYKIQTKGSGLNKKILYDKFDITKNDVIRSGAHEYTMFITEENSKKIEKFKNVISVKRNIDTTKINLDIRIFPNTNSSNWNIDNFGPITIPKKGSTINLNKENLAIYKDVIKRYESNNLKVTDQGIFINDKLTSEYTFQMNYYWMMGDNRHNSADSRMWGFVPEDHIVGKALFVWMSWDTNAKGLNKIRWDRLFTSVK
ncbi:MAG: signal peptidase I [Flavobacteriales bacterium]|nr:signal peptidase I [Flavobacteriales bacterium]